jgi:hypothetical protein
MQNKGAGGADLITWFRKDFLARPITDIAYCFGRNCRINQPGWIRINRDLNEGAGGLC